MAHCNAVACRTEIPSTRLFCEIHERMMRQETAKAIARSFRPGERQSITLREAIDDAQREILYFQLEGHRVPSASSFEW